MMCNKGEIIVVTSKSFFLPKELKRRILKGYCKGDKPSGIYIYIYVYIGPGAQSEDIK